MSNLQYLNSTKKEFEYYKLLGEKTIEQLTDEQLHFQFNEEGNSISIIVNHLWGNMLSRWTDFIITDGEKEWRNRDSEFENKITSRQELLEKWVEGWDCLFNALNSITDLDLMKEIYIRNQNHTILEAKNRQLAHYSYHIGQIVFIGKTLNTKNWKSLSIPKGRSKEYNRDKFSQ